MCYQVSFEELVDYIEGRLGTDEASRVAEHVAHCSSCAGDVAWLRRVLDLMAAPALVSAPPEVIRRAQALYQAAPRRAALRLPSLTAWLGGMRRAFPAAGALRYAAAVAVAALLILSGTWLAWGNTCVAEAATLAEVHGPVEVRLSPEGEWQPAVAGMVLTAGSALRSGEGASATLVYPDGSQTQLTENAQLEILSLQRRRNQQATMVRLSQITGRTQHEMATDKSSVRVEVDGAAAQARKGGYEVRVTDDAVEVHAARGSVDVQAGGKTIHLSQGQRGRIKSGRVQVTPPENEKKDPASERGGERPGSAEEPAGEAQGPAHSAPSSRGGPEPQPPAVGKGADGTLPPGQSDRTSATEDEPGIGQADRAPASGGTAVAEPAREGASPGPKEAARREPKPGSRLPRGWALGSKWRVERIRPASPSNR